MDNKILFEGTGVEFLKLDMEEHNKLTLEMFDPKLGYHVEDFRDKENNLKYINCNREGDGSEIVLEVLKEGFEKEDTNKIICYGDSVAIEQIDKNETQLRLLEPHEADTIVNVTIKKLIIWDNTSIQAIY